MRSEPPADGAVELVIQSRRGWIAIDWRELFRYRELLYFLVWRDVKVRYKQTILGFAWAVLQPLINALIATFIFGYAAGFRAFLPEGVPFILFALIGQIPWQFFATGVSGGGMSLVSQQHLLTKIYFPRLFLPTGIVGSTLFDMCISYAVLAVFLVIFGHAPTVWVVFLPLLVLLTAMASLAVAYTLSALTVTYRDFRFIIPFSVQIWMLMSFVMFPLPRGIVEKHAWVDWVLAINPMYGIIRAFRCMFGVSPEYLPFNPWHLVWATCVTLALLVFGMFYFRKTERRFADIA